MRILGKGKTAQAIAQKFPDAVMFDDSDIEKFDKNSDELTVVSPGIPPYNELVQSTKNLISEYDLLSSTMPYSIWISGTNGKTTTTSMMQHLLEKYDAVCGGNIGTPLANMDHEKPIWILETSSFTLNYTNMAKPNIYVLLPVSEDHITWHGSFEEYEKSKLKPLDSLQEGEIAIVPTKYKDYPTNGYKICYENSSDLEKAFDINKNMINFKEPFLIDAILALAITRILYDEVDYKKINSFIQDHHKLEEIKDFQDRIWINDSKATNIDATIQALKIYKSQKIYLILGGDDKGVDLKPLFHQMQDYDIEIYAIASNTDKISKLSAEYSVVCHKCYELKFAVETISSSLLNNNSTVALLSPAAASLDQFKSYSHRGEQFKELVLNLR